MLTHTSNSTRASYQLSVAGSQFVPAADVFLFVPYFVARPGFEKVLRPAHWSIDPGKVRAFRSDDWPPTSDH